MCWVSWFARKLYLRLAGLVAVVVVVEVGAVASDYWVKVKSSCDRAGTTRISDQFRCL